MRYRLILLHRWLGIAGNLLFVVWFASALVMMYARMPALDPGDRLNRLPGLDPETVRIGPAQAAAAAGLDTGGQGALQVRLGMAGDRPMYRFRTADGWTSVYADTGSPMFQLSQPQATAIATRFAGTRLAGPAGRQAGRPAEPSYDRLLSRPDQWTLQLRSLFPLHRIRVGSDVLYVSDRTAEVVMETNPASRFWGAAGAVFHWLYFTPLRSHSTFWRQLVVWAAAAGCVLTLSGVAVGLIRLNRRNRSPYSGIMRWHHYSGLVFGAAAFTWVLSGALSMDPFGWHAGRATSQGQHAAVAGEMRLDDFDLASIRTALLSVSESFQPREVEFLSFDGEPLLLAYRPHAASDGASGRADAGPNAGSDAHAPDTATAGRGRYLASYLGSPSAFLATVQPFEHRLLTPGSGETRRFDRQELLAAAARAMPGAEVLGVDRLTEYDAYYGDRRDGRTALPALRVRFNDRHRTWLYLDPALGRIVHREQRWSRIDRWLYRGLHRLDFPGFYSRRPLWDIVVIVLLTGGLFSSVSSLAPAARRLRHHGARLRRRKH